MAGILPTIVDVSSWQGDVVWPTAKPDIHFAILRVQDGTFLDKKLARNIGYCEQCGIPYYCYGFYRNGGATEAARMVSRAKAAGATKVRGYILDVEVSGQSISGIKAAMATLNANGLDNGIYIANNLYSEYGTTSYGEKWRWIPKYGTNDGRAHTPPNHPCDLWQFTSAGKVPGIGDSVDCNALIGKRSLASFTAAIASVIEKKQVVTADISLSSIVLLGNVLAGDYGSGEDRKKALGSRYDEIQTLVNHVCTASVSTLRDETLAGKYGNGNERKRALGTRYAEVQEAINKAIKPSRTYIVKRGDTLSHIGAVLGVNWRTIASKNGISSPYTIYPGQKLKY